MLFASIEENARAKVDSIAMPSPAIHLRAPLLWLLLPFMGGLIAAHFWPAPPFHLAWLGCFAIFLAGFAAWLAFFPGRMAHVGWMLCLGAAISTGAFAM